MTPRLHSKLQHLARWIQHADSDSASKLSDSASRFSTIETNIVELDISFKNTFLELHQQARYQEDNHSIHEQALDTILKILQTNLNINARQSSTNQMAMTSDQQHTTVEDSSSVPEEANNPEVHTNGGSFGATSHC
jgi:hypothetical protein